MSKHISAKRVAMSKELDLWKKLKKPYMQIKGLSRGKSPIELFKYCYPNLWRDVCEYHEEMRKWNASRIKKKSRLLSKQCELILWLNSIKVKLKRLNENDIYSTPSLVMFHNI